MKIALCIFCVLCAAAAFGQNVVGVGSYSAEPVPIVIPTHPAHASQKPMLSEQSLLGTSTYVTAHGERPLWEFAPKVVEVPLGDIARTLRKEREIAKKSAAVFEN